MAERATVARSVASWDIALMRHMGGSILHFKRRAHIWHSILRSCTCIASGNSTTTNGQFGVLVVSAWCTISHNVGM